MGVLLPASVVVSLSYPAPSGLSWKYDALMIEVWQHNISLPNMTATTTYVPPIAQVHDVT